MLEFLPKVFRLRRVIVKPYQNHCQFLQKPLFQSLRLISNDAKEDPFMVSFLINRFGFSRKSALSASKYLPYLTPDKTESLVKLLGSHGFSETQVAAIFKRSPILLTLHVSTIVRKIEFFESKGFSRGQVAEMFCACPHLLSRGLESHLIPSLDFIVELSQSFDKALAAIGSCPELLDRNLDDYSKPVVSLLRENGVPVEKIVLFLRYRQDATAVDLNKLREIVEKVKAMGISPSKAQFVVAIIVLRTIGESEWDRKIRAFKKWGLSEEEIMAAFRKQPWFMGSSEGKMMAAMDFFVNQFGWEASKIAKMPILLLLSLKKRIIPRAAVFQFLSSKGILKEEHSNFYVYFTYTEGYFLQRFVSCYKEAPELLKLYKEKLKSSR